MHNVGSRLEPGPELENFAVVEEELFFGVDFAPSQLLFEVLLHDGVLFRQPFAVDFGGPLVTLVGFGWALGLPKFLVELAGVVITVVQVDVPTVNRDGLPQSEVMGSQELAVLVETFLPPEESFAHGEAVVFLFLLIHLDGVILKVEEELYFAVAFVFEVAFNDCLLEEAVEPEDVPVQMDPVRLVKLRRVFGDILCVEVLLTCR